MKLKFTRLIIYISIGLLFSSCATVLKGRYATKNISIDSTPGNTKVYMDGEYIGNTPLVQTIHSRKKHRFRFEKEGYIPRIYYLGRHVQLGYLLLDFTMFPYAPLLDLITGAWFTSNSKKIMVRLEPDGKNKPIEDDNDESIVAKTPQPKKVEPKISLSDIDVNIPKTKKVNGNAIAVVIGNQSYTHHDIPNVDYAINDARTMKEYLIQTFGFKEENILYVEDATQSKFNSLFGTSDNHKGRLYNYVKANESDVFIYYSGHGVPDVETNEAYFAPVDCDPSLVSLNGYSIDVFYNNISKIPFKSLNVVIDACFSGNSDAGALIKQASPVLIKTKSKVFQNPKSSLFTSCASNQISSWYPEKRHSLFTYYYLKGIQGSANTNGDKKITLEEIQEYIFKEVSYRARRLHNRMQTPDIIGNEEKVIVSF